MIPGGFSDLMSEQWQCIMGKVIGIQKHAGKYHLLWSLFRHPCCTNFDLETPKLDINFTT